MYNRILFLLFLLNLATLQVLAQIDARFAEAPFELFNNKHGLSQAFVPDIVQDQDGYMWFATNDGLNRYDGYTVDVFRQNPSDTYALPDNSICAIEEDQHGRLWVATVSKGLFLFDKKKERFYPVPIPSREVYGLGLLQFEQNNLFLGNSEGFFVYDISALGKAFPSVHDTARCYKLYDFNVNDASIKERYGSGWFAAHGLPNGSLGLGKKDTLLLIQPKKENNSFSVYLLPAKQFGLEGEEFYHFASLGHSDTLCFVGVSTVSMFNTKTKELLYSKSFASEKITKEIFYPNRPAFLRDGSILFCSAKHWYHFNSKTKTYTILESKNGIGQFSGISHMLDRDSTLWIGSSGRGVFKFNFRNTLFHSVPDDCYGIEEDALHQVIIRFRQGVRCFDPVSKSRTAFVPKSLWRSDWFWEDLFSANPQGVTWIRAASRSRKSEDGKANKLLLLQYDPIKQQIAEFNQLYDATIYKDYNNLKLIFSGKDNRLWQLYQYDQPPTFRLNVVDGKTYLPLSQIPLPISKTQNPEVYRFYGVLDDGRGNLWLGTNAGLFRYQTQTKQWRVYSSGKSEKDLSGDKILSMETDPLKPDSFLWVGTDGQGLNKMNIHTGKCITYRTAQGLPNNTICGLLHDALGNLWISTNQGLSCFDLKHHVFRNYNTENGLPGNEFNTRQQLRCTNGTLFFAGIDGIVWFQPKEIINSILPENNVVFTRFSLFNKEVDPKQDSSILPYALAFTERITLPHDKNLFSIEFALLHYSSAEKKRYRYWLEGFNAHWIENGSKNSVTFTNLDPGMYTLHVKGCNSDGVWTRNGKTLQIHILAPWYDTWWFRIAATLMVFGGLYAFYRFRLQQRTRLITMRNHIASDLHDEIGSTISSIVVYSDILKEKEQDKDLLLIANRVNESSKNILTVMSDIVWSINPINDRFDNVILRMKEHAHEVLASQNKTLHFDVDERLNTISLNMNERKNFYLIFKEALNNILKYAQADTVWISLNLIKDQLQFKIKDNGQGFNLNDYKEGNGIVNMQVRSKALKGEIQFSSSPGEGTTILLNFPVM